MMPVVHDSTTEVTQNEPEHGPENRLECRIHEGKNNREEIGVKRKSPLVAASLMSVEPVSGRICQSNSKTTCSTGLLHTGANDCRCSGVGPYFSRAARCCGVPYPLCEAKPDSGK